MWPSPGSSKIYSDPPLPPDKHGLWLDCATIPWSFTQTHLLARITQPPIAYFSAITVYPGPFRQLTFLFTFALLWIIFVWFSQSKLGEYADLFISNGFDSLELIFECVDKQLLEEQFAEGICLPVYGSSCSKQFDSKKKVNHLAKQRWACTTGFKKMTFQVILKHLSTRVMMI